MLCYLCQIWKNFLVDICIYLVVIYIVLFVLVFIIFLYEVFKRKVKCYYKFLLLNSLLYY